jgi:tetraacyldisaccharide 4'-kinase
MMSPRRILLFPFSKLYGLVVWVRNLCYDKGWLQSERGALPTLIVGNISVGGTGKTPHTLWLAEQLRDLRPAILSRGYGRSTRGYRQVHRNDLASDVGDEPLLYARLLNGVPVRVCENRVIGVSRIADEATSRMVILDDAMQHRKLKGDFVLALIHSERMPFDDDYLPGGLLRDHLVRLRQADAVIITHAASDESADPPIRAKINHLKRYARLPEYLPVFLSSTHYGALNLMGSSTAAYPKRIVALCGIANPDQFLRYLETQFEVVEALIYGDHHPFSSRMARDWANVLSTHGADALVTTEKDWMRMASIEEARELPIYTLPVQVNVADGNLLIEAIRLQMHGI